MKRLITATLLISIIGFGCATQTINVVDRAYGDVKIRTTYDNWERFPSLSSVYAKANKECAPKKAVLLQEQCGDIQTTWAFIQTCIAKEYLFRCNPPE